ncbi:MAG: carboxylating nicotinate-nucleotide diphosphorylase [Dehalococcoidia bacterium]|nr:carboxylating nicotinate-nucleotide diphosphorylase [Dehalococcoidia bacterium]
MTAPRLTLETEKIIELALAEDLGRGDITTDTLIPPAWRGKGALLVKAPGILAGIRIAARVFRKVDPDTKLRVLVRDGSTVRPGDIVGTVTGPYASILKAERVALNFLQRLSGVATETARYVEAVKGLPVKILDTRKTTPGMRLLEKYAVRMGGGINHRLDLSDGILIKDNHISALKKQGLSLEEIIARAKKNRRRLKVEIEVTSVAEAIRAAEAGADIIMLDNMDLTEMRRAVEAGKGKAMVEASGGMTLDRVRAVAETGVDFISIGAITHSARALDISLELERTY